MSLYLMYSYDGLQNRLDRLQGDFNATAANAQKVLSFLSPKDKLSKQVAFNIPVDYFSPLWTST